MTSNKLSAFSRSDIVYKTVNGHPIEASIFVPRHAKAGAYPVMIRWHGGGLLNGGRCYEPWWPLWSIDLANRHSAILISPDYRLLPESSGLDILSDISDFYSWLHSSLNTHVASVAPITADLNRTLITGESAGGYIATQSALLFSNPKNDDDDGKRFPSAVVGHYPMLDLREAYYSRPKSAPLLNSSNMSPLFQEGGGLDDVIDAYIASIKPGTVVTERLPGGDSLDLFNVLIQAGRYTGVLGDEDVLYPLENLDRVKVKGGGVSPIWLFHGVDDSAVPARGTEAYAAKAKALGLDGDLKVSFVEGVDHGFDGSADLDTEWVKEGVEWIDKYWP